MAPEGQKDVITIQRWQLALGVTIVLGLIGTLWGVTTWFTRDWVYSITEKVDKNTEASNRTLISLAEIQAQLKANAAVSTNLSKHMTDPSLHHQEFGRIRQEMAKVESRVDLNEKRLDRLEQSSVSIGRVYEELARSTIQFVRFVTHTGGYHDAPNRGITIFGRPVNIDRAMAIVLGIPSLQASRD